MSNRKPLSRGQKIAIWAIIAPVLVATISWFVESRLRQQPQIAVTGNGSSAANAVSGYQNIVGNNNTVIQPPVAAPSQPNTADSPQRKTGTTSGSLASQSPSTIANAPGGIAITGGTVTNATVIDYGPPPVEIRFNTRPIPSTDPQFEYEAEVAVSVNAPYSPVSLAFVCDSEIKKVLFDFGRFASAMLNVRLGVDGGNNKIGFVMFDGTSVTPERPLYVHIFALAPFRVVAVQQAKLAN